MMMRTLLLYAMAPEVSFNGTTLAKGTLPNFEIMQRIKEAMEPLRDNTGAALNFFYPVPGHPPMRMEPGYVVFISFPFLLPSLQLISQPRETNFERGGTSRGTSSSQITRRCYRGIRP